MFSDEVFDRPETEESFDQETETTKKQRKNNEYEQDSPTPVVNCEKLALDELCGRDPMTREEEAYYFEQLHTHEEGTPEWRAAYSEIVQANMRMVVKIVKDGFTNSITPAMGFMDMVQEGYMAIDKAIRKFDHTKGIKFSTYVYKAISREIQRAIASKGITMSSIGANKHMKMRRTLAIRNSILNEGTHNPTPEELAELTGYKLNDVKEYLRMSTPMLSLDQTIGNDSDDTDETELMNLISDKSVDVEGIAIDNADLEKYKAYAKKYLSEEAYIIIDARCFRDPKVPMEDLAEILGRTTQSIHMLKSKSIKLLRYLSVHEGKMPEWKGDTSEEIEAEESEDMATAAFSAANLDELDERGELF